MQTRPEPQARIRPHNDCEFQERPGEIGNLIDILTSTEHGAPRLALVGMGGKGKTRLAYELVQHLNQQNLFPGKIFWLEAQELTTKKQWEDAFAQLAKESNYLPPNENEASSEVTELRTRYICDYLSKHADALIVFDDVEDPDIAVNILPEISGCETCCAIIYTSRNSRSPDVSYRALIHVYKVDKLPDKAAHKLLLEWRPELLEVIISDANHPETRAAHAISEAIENLPLTLKLLRNLLKRDQYLSLMKLAEGLQEQGQIGIVDKDSKAKEALEHVFYLTWQRIDREDARRLLQCASYFPAITAIPLRLLGIAMGREEDILNILRPLGYACKQLEELSLLERLSEEEISLHSLLRDLVQVHIRLNLNQASSLQSKALANLRGEFIHFNNLAVRSQSKGYWQCLELVRSAGKYATSLNEGHEIREFVHIERCLRQESNLLGNTQLWPERLPGFFYQQLYNHFVEENISDRRGIPPLRWVRLEKKVGGRGPSPLWEIPCNAFIRKLALSSDCSLVALALHDLTKGKRSIKIYDIANGCLKSYISDIDLDTMMDIIFTPDDSRIVVVDGSGYVAEWNATNSEQSSLHKFVLEKKFTCMALSPEGKRCAAGTETGVCLYQREDEEGSYLPDCDAPVKDKCLVFSQDGAWIAAGTTDHIYLWDTQHEILLNQIPYKSEITCLAFSPDRKRLAVGSQDEYTSILDISRGKWLKLLDKTGYAVTCLAFSTDGTKIIIGSESASAQLWDVDTTVSTNEPLANFPELNGAVTNAIFTSDNSSVITTSVRGTIRAWDITQAMQLSSEHVDLIENLAFSSNGTNVLTISKDSQIQQWNAEMPQKPTTLFSNRISQQGRATCIASCPHRNLVGIGTSTGSIFLGDISQPKNLIELGRHDSRVTCLAFSPCGNFLAIGSKDRGVHLYDLTMYDTKPRKPVIRLQNHNNLVSTLTFSPNSAHLVTSTSDGALYLWDRATGQCLASFVCQDSFIRQICISPDGTTLAVGTANGAIYIWPTKDLNNAQPLCLVQPTHNEITALACAPDSSFLIVCYDNCQTDFVYLADFPVEDPPLLGKFTTAAQVNAIYWKDARRLVLVGPGETSNHPSFYHLTIEGNWSI